MSGKDEIARKRNFRQWNSYLSKKSGSRLASSARGTVSRTAAVERRARVLPSQRASLPAIVLFRRWDVCLHVPVVEVSASIQQNISEIRIRFSYMFLLEKSKRSDFTKINLLIFGGKKINLDTDLDPEAYSEYSHVSWQQLCPEYFGVKLIPLININCYLCLC